METGGVWLRSLKGDRGGVIFPSRLETLASPASSLARSTPVSWLGGHVLGIVVTGFRRFMAVSSSAFTGSPLRSLSEASIPAIAFSRHGIVRVTERELADRRRSRSSRGELTPFSERRRAVLLEYVAAIEVAGTVEVVVNRGMGGGEFLQGFHVPEPRHRPLSSSERLMRVLGSIVEPPTADLIGGIADDLHR